MMLDSHKDREVKIRLTRFLYDIKALSHSGYCDAMNTVNLRAILRTLTKG